MNTALVQLKELTKDQPENPLRPAQIEEHHAELRRLGAMAAGKDMDGHPQHWIPGDRGLARKRAREIQQAMERDHPKKIDGERASAVHRLAGEVMETVIRPGLLPRSTMRRHPPGAVGHVLRTEFARPFKDAVLVWKRAMRGLDPTNADPDFTNVERFRAEGTGDGTSSFMADAQIPGHLAMSARAKENWPLGAPTADTPLKQAHRRERAKPGPKPGPIYTCAADGCGKEYRGGFGKQNLQVHMAKAHPVEEGV